MLYLLNRILFFYFVCVCILPNDLQAQESNSQPSIALKGLIDEIVTSYLEQENTKSLSVGIIDGEHDYHYYYGSLSENHPTPPDATSLYALGSASKIFTAYIMMKLVEAEELSLDTPLTSFFPKYLSNPVSQKLNPHLLASHQSGLPDKAQNFHLANKDPKNPFQHYSDSLSLEYLNTCRESKKNHPIGKFRFSNYNYMVLGQILETASQTSFSDLFEKHILADLALSNISVDLPKKVSAIAPPHSVVGKEISPWKFNSYDSSMGIYSSLPATLTFLRTWITASNSSDWEMIQECMMEQTDTDKKHVRAGYGWFIYPRSKKSPPLYTVSGKTDGSWSYLAMVPETKTAVVILSNSKHSVYELGITIIDLLNR